MTAAPHTYSWDSEQFVFGKIPKRYWQICSVKPPLLTALHTHLSSSLSSHSGWPWHQPCALSITVLPRQWALGYGCAVKLCGALHSGVDIAKLFLSFLLHSFIVHIFVLPFSIIKNYDNIDKSNLRNILNVCTLKIKCFFKPLTKNSDQEVMNWPNTCSLWVHNHNMSYSLENVYVCVTGKRRFSDFPECYQWVWDLTPDTHTRHVQVQAPPAVHSQQH